MGIRAELRIRAELSGKYRDIFILQMMSCVRTNDGVDANNHEFITKKGGICCIQAADTLTGSIHTPGQFRETRRTKESS